MRGSLPIMREWIRSFLSHQIQKYKNEKRSTQEALLNAYNTSLAIEIQCVLGDILSHSTVSTSLSSIRSKEDILPCGFNCMYERSFYYFSLPKATNEPLSSVIVNRITDSINRAIKSRRDQLFYNASTLDDLSRVDYYMQNRMLYNGFYVSDSKDDYDRIIIAVSFF